MIIFSPGPSNISERVRRALLAPDICHRDEEFTELLRSVRERILTVAGVRAPDYESVVLTGSGSVGIESVVAAAKPAGKMLVVSNGPYGERAAAMARYHGVDVHELKLAWGEEINLGRVDAELVSAGATSCYLVHHETATGRLNPLRELAACAKARGCLVLVDAVSSIAGETLDIAGWQIDAVVGSANKCIRGVPGTAFVIASRAFLDVAGRQRAAHYSNLAAHLTSESRGETPFTPAVQVMYAFHEALGETLDETVAARTAHYRNLMQIAQNGFAEMGISFLLPRAAYGNTLLSCALPAGHTFADLHRALKAHGYVIYAAQGALMQRAFRIGLIGHFGESDVRGMLGAFAEAGARVRAVILAAGRGTRLRDVTDSPKCLFAPGGVALIDRYLAALDALEIPVTIVVGYRADEVERHVRALAPRVAPTFVRNEQFEIGSVVSLARGLESFDGDLLLMDGDVLFHPELLTALVRSPDANALLVDIGATFTAEEYMAGVDGTRVTELRRAPVPGHERAGEWVGFAKLSSRAVTLLNRSINVQIAAGKTGGGYEDALALCLPAAEFTCVETLGKPWIEIDFPADAERARSAQENESA